MRDGPSGIVQQKGVYHAPISSGAVPEGARPRDAFARELPGFMGVGATESTPLQRPLDSSVNRTANGRASSVCRMSNCSEVRHDLHLGVRRQHHLRHCVRSLAWTAAFLVFSHDRMHDILCLALQHREFSCVFSSVRFS
ncbi:hypothetical protein VPH35_025609 [Triticum aestivum]